MVSEATPGGPGQRAGLRPGDILLSFDGAPVAGVDDLHRALTAERAGRAVGLSVLRRNEMLALTVTPAET
jgi:S1-C subfamily serine protease